MITVAPLPTVPTSPIQDYKPPTTTNPDAVDQGAHAFKSPGPGDLRSPCPALDTLANHSYIHHDGRDISYDDLVSALRKAYGISFGFAHFLTMGSFILLRRSPFSKLNLKEVARYDHGRWCIAHNCALVHGDAEGHRYAPWELDEKLLHKLLTKEYTPPCVREAEAKDQITEKDITYARVARTAVCGPNDEPHKNIARGEFAMVLNILGKGSPKTLNQQDLELFLKQNRFPDGWAPSHTETLRQTAWENEKLRELMVEIRQTTGQVQESWSSYLSSYLERATVGFIQKLASAAHLTGNDVHTNNASEGVHSQ